jgi:hypothetical protein
MKFPRWPRLVAAQALTASALTVAAVFLLPADSAAGFPYLAMMWFAVPLSGALTAFYMVRRGVVAFAAFWLPPVLQTLVHWLVAGLPPLSVGMPLATGLISLVGAATADELSRRKGPARPRRKKK